jgi:hypothetical protein
MKDAKKQFAAQLKKALEKAGLEPIPSILEREFNQKTMGGDITLHGVRRWLEGEVIPTRGKLEVLEKWLKADFVQFRPAKLNPKSTGVKENAGEWRAKIPAQELEIVEMFLGLPTQQKKIIREVIQAFAKK